MSDNTDRIVHEAPNLRIRLTLGSKLGDQLADHYNFHGPGENQLTPQSNGVKNGTIIEQDKKPDKHTMITTFYHNIYCVIVTHIV